MEIDQAVRAALKLALLPPGGILLLLLLGWALSRRPVGRVLVLAAGLALYAVSTPAVISRLAERVETVPAPEPAELQRAGADAILVLMAGRRSSNPEYGGAEAMSTLSLQRVDHALHLHRLTGLPIVVSGGGDPDRGLPLAQLGADWLADRAAVEVLAIETRSRDTWANAHNSSRLLARLGLERVLLVTHAFHMPRALFSATAAGIDAVPAPFGFMHTPESLREPAVLLDWLPHAGSLARGYLLLHEAAGLAGYRLRRGGGVAGANTGVGPRPAELYVQTAIPD